MLLHSSILLFSVKVMALEINFAVSDTGGKRMKPALYFFGVDDASA